MIREKYIKRVKELNVNIVQTEVKSVGKKDITKVGYRVYDNGYIGVGGAVGDVDEKQLEKRALDNLNLKIPYPYKPSENLVKEVDYREKTPSDEEFVTEIEELLSILRKEFPEFVFSNKIHLSEFETRLANDVGLNLVHKDRFVMSELIIKEKTSINVIDAFAGYVDRIYNKDKFLQTIRDTLNAYKNPVKLPHEGKMPVVFMDNDILPFTKLIEELDGYKVGTGASLFKDYIGHKKFNDNFTLLQSTQREDLTSFEFFDAEGTVNEDFKYTLIENGKIISPYTDKKTAHQFNLPLTGSASCEYDMVPTLSPRNFKVVPSHKTLKELLDGQMAVVVSIAAGGDFTDEGVFGTPVQLAFLTDGEKLIGRLPELSLSGELYSMFGQDYIGKSKDKPFLDQRFLALNLDVRYL